MSEIEVSKMSDTNMLQCVLEKIESMSKDLKKEIRETQDMCVEICRDCRDLIKEVNKELREKLLDLEKRYNEKFTELNKEIKQLKRESDVTKKEVAPNDRRKNIVISGGKFHLKREGTAKAVEKFIETKLEIEVNIDEVTIINQHGKNPKILLKLLKMEDKKLIMKNKNKLRQLEELIFIDDDLSKEERDIQKKVREAAKIERRKGKKISVGFQKLKINGKWINIIDYRGEQ